MNVFDKHQLAIARRTLQLSDEGAKIMGGMTKDEARQIINRFAPRKSRKGQPKETYRTFLNAGKTKIAAGAVCDKCGKPFAEGERIACRTFKSATMPAPGFYYSHSECAK